MPRIYISHRPEDTSHNEVKAIYRRLSDEFGTHNILQSTGSNLEIKAELQSIIGSCDFVLIVIGRYWFDMVDDDGTRLLDNPFDPVRIEVETSIEYKKPITVLLVDGIRLPDEQNMFASLRPLIRRKQIHMGPHSDFDAIIEDLVHNIKRDLVRYQIVSDIEMATQPTMNLFIRLWRTWRADLKTAVTVLLALLGMLAIAYLTTNHVVSRLPTQ